MSTLFLQKDALADKDTTWNEQTHKWSHLMCAFYCSYDYILAIYIISSISFLSREIYKG